MNEMVERVARAICQADFENPDADYGGHPRWRAFEANAMAAIEAMRNPAPAQVEEGQARLRYTPIKHCPAEAVAVYQGMIDAALAEEEAE